MDVRYLIRAKKRLSDSGKWQTGKMPATAFPLSKSRAKALRYGNRRWRVVQFSAAEVPCRLLINYHPSKRQFQALLGVERDGDMRVALALEHHPTHHPWHVHAACCPLREIPAGIKRGPWVRQLLANGIRHRTPCPETDADAYARAASFFRLDLGNEGTLL
jgi:hypothetical protein